MRSEFIEVRALRVRQSSSSELYAFFLSSEQLGNIADISRISREEDVLLGYQRGEVKRHVDEIAAYLQSGPVLFPNAIILALSSNATFERSRDPRMGGQECDPGTLAIPLRPPGKRAAWIVDGQQRTLALQKTNSHELLVPVTGFVSDDLEIHRAQFLLVNKVRPLPKDLIDELLPEVNTALPSAFSERKIASHLCNILNEDPESPFKDLIIRRSTDRKQQKTAVIAANSLIQVIQKSLNSALGCLHHYQNTASGEVEVDLIRATLNLYWSVVRDLFSDAWGLPPKKSRLMHGAGIKSMGILMDHVMTDVDLQKDDAYNKIVTALRPIEPFCAWTGGTWPKLDGGLQWNHLQNTPSDVKRLSDMFLELIRNFD